MKHPFSRPPERLVSAAPQGTRSDPNLGLQRLVVRDTFEPDEDPCGLGLPERRDGWEDVELSLRFERWLRRQQFAVHPHLTAVEWAEDFVNYLDECLLTIYGCCERDLRTYLYDYVPSERPLRTQRRPHVVLSALRQFFEYLSRHEEVYYPWAAGILADQAALARRWSTYPHGALDDDRMIEWRRILHDDLSARVLLPDVAMAGGGEWLKPGIVPEIGDDEDEWALSILFTLHDELSRRWLFWREEVLAAGVTEPARARAVLLRRQREWETRPHPGLGGEAPAEAVRKARKGK